MQRSRRAVLALAGTLTTAGLLGRAVGRVRAAPQPEPVSFFANRRIVSLYGTPLAPGLGALGQGTPVQMVERLRTQAAGYEALEPAWITQPAFHLIYALAQADAGADGLYLAHTPDAVVEDLIALARQNGFLLFLDLQMGRSTIAREVGGVAHWLAQPEVHLALDPEFAWGHPGLVPGGGPNASIGYLSADQVNEAQTLLQGVAAESGLSSKIMIVHQFRHGMLPDKQNIRRYDGVDLVIDMDGFGPPVTKRATYAAVITDDGVDPAAIKLFYQHDQPLLSPEEVLALTPRPAVVIYQ